MELRQRGFDNLTHRAKSFLLGLLIALNNILWLMDEIKWNVNALISVMNIKPTLPLCSGVEGAVETSRRKKKDKSSNHITIV